MKVSEEKTNLGYRALEDNLNRVDTSDPQYKMLVEASKLLAPLLIKGCLISFTFGAGIVLIIAFFIHGGDMFMTLLIAFFPVLALFSLPALILYRRLSRFTVKRV